MPRHWRLRHEVVDLEAAGIHAIQIGEPAPREGLPRQTPVANHGLAVAVA